MTYGLSWVTDLTSGESACDGVQFNVKHKARDVILLDLKSGMPYDDKYLLVEYIYNGNILI